MKWYDEIHDKPLGTGKQGDYWSIPYYQRYQKFGAKKIFKQTATGGSGMVSTEPAMKKMKAGGDPTQVISEWRAQLVKSRICRCWDLGC